MATPDYLLGHHAQEWSRLEEQHLLWADTLLEALDGLGLTQGHHCLEIGCGTGALLEDLAKRVGPTGKVVGIERDPDAAQVTDARCSDLENASVIQGDALDTPPGGPYDFIVARWVFSFFPDPAAAVLHLSEQLKPGGHLVIQDYNHDGFRIFPDADGFPEVVEAYRAAYRQIGGDLWVAARMPTYLTAAGLHVALTEPHIKAGAPDSAMFAWVSRFLLEHLDTVVSSGHLSQDDAQRFVAGWAEATRRADTLLFSPIQVTVAGRKSSS